MDQRYLEELDRIIKSVQEAEEKQMKKKEMTIQMSLEEFFNNYYLVSGEKYDN